MNTTFRENRTRMYQRPERFRMNGSEYECQLSEEQLAAIEAASTRVATARRPVPSPPVYRPPMVINPPPAKPSATPWIVALLGIVLIGMIATRGHQSPGPSQVAIPAQPSATPAPQREIGAQQTTTLPDGNTVPTIFRGFLNDVSQLPHHGAQPGDMWGVGHNLWVLTTSANAYKVGWVDPPNGDQPEVRRALSVDSVEVRRAQMVVPRAKLVRN